jgi:hypothetical protein
MDSQLEGHTAVMVDSMLWHTLASCWRCHLQAQKMTFAVELATLLSVLQKPWTRSLRATRRSWLTVCFGTLWLRAGGVTCMLKRFTFAVELATLLSVLQKPWTRSLRGARVNNFFFPAAMVWSRGRDERQRQAVVAELELPVRLTQLALTTFSFQQPWFGAAAETSDSGGSCSRVGVTRKADPARVNSFFFPAAMVWSRGRDERQRKAVVAEL